MATVLPDISTGTTITFDSGFFAEIINLEHSGMERGSVDVTHMGSTVERESLPTDLFDPGELTVELHFAAQTRPPIDNAAETCTVTFPGGTTWAGSAFMTNWAYSAPLEDKMTGTGTLKYDGIGTKFTITAN